MTALLLPATAAVCRAPRLQLIGLWAESVLPHPDAMTGGYEDDLGLGAPSLRALLDALAALAPA